MQPYVQSFADNNGIGNGNRGLSQNPSGEPCRKNNPKSSQCLDSILQRTFKLSHRSDKTSEKTGTTSPDRRSVLRKDSRARAVMLRNAMSSDRRPTSQPDTESHAQQHSAGLCQGAVSSLSCFGMHCDSQFVSYLDLALLTPGAIDMLKAPDFQFNQHISRHSRGCWHTDSHASTGHLARC